MEVAPEGVDQASLLPRIVIGASQRDQDVIRTERADRVVESGERRLIAELCVGLGVWGEGLEVAEDNAEALVGLVPRAVCVRGKPSKPTDENRRDDEDLRGTMDERADVRRKFFDVRGSFAGRYQKPRLAWRCHASIMPGPRPHYDEALESCALSPEEVDR
jgi:hypothetical protein